MRACLHLLQDRVVHLEREAAHAQERSDAMTHAKSQELQQENELLRKRLELVSADRSTLFHHLQRMSMALWRGDREEMPATDGDHTGAGGAGAAKCTNTAMSLDRPTAHGAVAQPFGAESRPRGAAFHEPTLLELQTMVQALLNTS